MDAQVAERNDTNQEPWPLPLSWCWATVGEITRPISTVDPRRQMKAVQFRYVDLGAIEDGKVTSPQYLFGADAPSRARQVAEIGDTLFSCVRVYLRNTAFVEDEASHTVVSTAFCVLRPAIDARYLNYFARSDRFVGWLTKAQRGNSPPAVLETDVKAQPMPVPPLAEQRRIVARIDALFAEIAEGEAALKEARHGLEVFRRALLKAAVTGELTKDWRAANPGIEADDELIYRSGHKPKNALAEHPQGWATVSIADLAISGPTNGYSPKASTNGSGTLALKLSATTHGHLDLSEKAVKRISEDIPLRSDLYLMSGDLLFQRGNTREYVGIAAIYEGPERKYIYPDLMIRVRTGSDIITYWIWRVANSPPGRRYMAQAASGSAGTMPKITGKTVRDFPVPIPPHAELAEIQQRLEDNLTIVSDTRKLIYQAVGDANRLRQSILKAAFEGRLVPQDPTDEPASALLNRLRTEPPSHRPKRRKRA